MRLVSAAIVSYLVYFLARHAIARLVREQYYSWQIQGLRSQLTLVAGFVLLSIAGRSSTDSSQSSLWLFLALSLNLGAEHLPTPLYASLGLQVLAFLGLRAFVNSAGMEEAVITPFTFLMMLTVPLHYAVRSIEKDVSDEVAEVMSLNVAAEDLNRLADPPSLMLREVLHVVLKATKADAVSLWKHSASDRAYFCSRAVFGLTAIPAEQARQTVDDRRAPTRGSDEDWRAARIGYPIALAAVPIAYRSDGRPLAVLEISGTADRQTARRALGNVGAVLGSVLSRYLAIERDEDLLARKWDITRLGGPRVAASVSDAFGYPCDIWSVDHRIDGYHLALTGSSINGATETDRVLPTLGIFGLDPLMTGASALGQEIGIVCTTDGRSMMSVPIVYAEEIRYVVQLFGPTNATFSPDELHLARVLSLIWSRQIQDEEAASLAVRAELIAEAHDTSVQDLHAIGNIARRVQREVSCGNTTKATTDSRLLMDVIGIARRNWRAFLRSSTINIRDSRDLTVALDEMIMVAHRTHPHVPVNLDLQRIPNFDRRSCRLIYRIVREAVRNSLEHSSGTQVSISLTEQLGTWHLLVTDDGVGFPQLVLSRAFEPEFGGLFTMERLAGHLGGELVLSNAGAGGAVVCVTIDRSGEEWIRTWDAMDHDRGK